MTVNDRSLFLSHASPRAPTPCPSETSESPGPGSGSSWGGLGQIFNFLGFASLVRESRLEGEADGLQNRSAQPLTSPDPLSLPRDFVTLPLGSRLALCLEQLEVIKRSGQASEPRPQEASQPLPSRCLSESRFRCVGKPGRPPGECETRGAAQPPARPGTDEAALARPRVGARWESPPAGCGPQACPTELSAHQRKPF